MSSLRLINELPEHLKEQFNNGDLLIKMISVEVENMDVRLQQAVEEGWTPVSSFAEGDRAWAILVTPIRTNNGDSIE